MKNRLQTQYLAYIGALTLTLTILHAAVPILIESMYQGRSIGLLNALINRQSEYGLDHYINEFNELFNYLCFFCAIGSYVLLIYLFFKEYKVNGASLLAFFDGLTQKHRLAFLCGAAAVLLLGAYIFTIWPGGTYVNVMTHDMFIFWDGAYRVSRGQMPYLDFHTPIGLLTYFLPFWGLKLSGQFPGSLEMSNLLTATWIAVTAVHILASRYRFLPSVIALIFLLLIIIVPMNLGETDMAHAMFYNRYAWVVLSLLYLFYLEPERQSKTQRLLDIVCMASLITFLFYLKLSYFMFALVFANLMALVSKPKRHLCAYALLIFTAVVIVLEILFNGLHFLYIKEILTALQSSGVVREQRNTFDNAIGELIFAAIGIYFIYKARPLRFFDYCYIALVVVSSLIIINQNSQTTGLVTVIALLLWGHEVSVRTRMRTEYRRGQQIASIPLSTVIIALLIFFTGQTVIPRAKGMIEFYSMTTAHRQDLATPAMPNLYIGERRMPLVELLQERDPVKLFNAITHSKRQQTLAQGEYIETIELGLSLIKEVNPNRASVLVFDMANPFSLLLGAKPPRGDYSFYHFKRNINANTRLPSDKLFAEVSFLMIPKLPMTPITSQFLLDNYSTYIYHHFFKRTENLAWEIYQKR
jgi:hypothetical protein